MSQAVLEELQREFPQYIRETHSHCGDDTAVIEPSGLVPIIEFLRDKIDHRFGRMNKLVDICGNDYPDREDRLEAVYHLMSTGNWKRLRLRVPVSASSPKLPSLTPYYKTANWYERETYDMFGIQFEGHPFLKRILTHWKFEGHPLRKDYPKEKRQHLDESAPIEWFGVHPHTKTDGTETIVVNIGPSHPVTHGIMRLVAELDGENLVDGQVEIGYLHRCMEKEAEAHTWGLVMPYADRLNYVSAPINTQTYAMAVEKLAGIVVPDRTKWLRMIMAEIGRIMDHCTLLGPALVDMGALTNFWYFFKIREAGYRVLDRFVGSRLTSTCDRIGGYALDTYEGFEEDVRNIRTVVEKYLGDVERLITKNRVFLDRTVNVGCMTSKQAIEFGLSGPIARATGYSYDVRKQYPYNFYDQIDFDVVVGSAGDTFDRLMVRIYEMKQCLRILDQALKGLAKTQGEPVMADIQDITLPSLDDTYTKMESMIRHFNIIYRGERVPKGESYFYAEGANGELGFYLVSDGGGKPFRCHVHPPCFSVMQTYTDIVKGCLLADAVIVFSSYNIIAGELER
ncbi:MAG: NADH-quinone oxidoreductase subunit D [Myxococcales bacterium]|nr:NADH-quinone oxidoreductase subunit D [Myxococcales bacterium]